jgi:hypothetical protein
MVSRVVLVSMDGKVIRHWDIKQIITNNDALKIQVGDILEIYENMYLRITYCGNTKRYTHRAWCGRLFGAKGKWGLDDNSVIALGPNGIAENFNKYEEGDFFDFMLGKNSYLWLGE